MPKINILDKNIAELIAAGEVVERPASVIKELVENSIDAGSTSITIEIRRGGISYIRISDNGHGISKNDVPIAFLRHATSKISSAIDLDSISSLGFRGEALASVSAVAHIEMISKTADEETGTKIVIHGGETEYIEDVGATVGTTIIVRDIFYNVPARMKFLKKDIGEGNAVSAIVDKIALSHPEISFKLIRDNKETLYTTGDGQLSSAIYGVYGKEFLNSLTDCSYSLGGITVDGFICKPSGARPSRTMQNFFINGRYIKTRTAMAALEEAFKGTIVTGKYPSCVLQISMDSSLYDVNVHPAKLEVRFANEKSIFNVIFHAVKSALLKNDTTKELIFAANKEPQIISSVLPKPVVTINPYAPAPEKQEQLNFDTAQTIKKVDIDIPYESVFKDTEETKKFIPDFETKIDKIFDGSFAPEPVRFIEKNPAKTIESVLEPVSKVDNYQKQEETKTEPIITNENIKPFTPFNSFYKLVGEAFNTYIIIEYENALFLIDKHAAHERLLYEKLKNDCSTYSQALIVPEKVTLDKISYNAILENLDKLESAGFLIEDFGVGTVLVREAPLNLVGQDINDTIIEISNCLLKNNSKISTEHLDWIYHNVACRAAIKGGKSSNQDEIINLVKLLEKNPELKNCPHGRPIYVKLSKYEIEKNFGRV